MTTPHYLTISQVCTALGISRSTLWRRRRAGLFPPPEDVLGFKRWPAEVLDGLGKTV